MFNRSAFNHLKFNQSNDYKILSAELGATANLKSKGQAVLAEQAHLSAESSFRQLTYLSANLSAESNIKATAGLLMRTRASLISETMLIARASKWQRREIVFTGTWLPGQVIIINHKELTLLLDGQNALKYANAQFGYLALGLNELVYSDTAAVRTVLAQIIYQQKNV